MLKRSSFCFVFLLFTISNSKAQLSDHFSDGNYTQNPAWAVTSGSWMINSALQLQSNNIIANSTFYISTQSAIANNAQWEFYVRLDFNPSSLNFIDVYLTASASDISQPGTAGYFVRIGNTDDEISLYRKDAGGIITKIIDGVNGILNKNTNLLKIKIIRNADNQWSLFRDLSGTGNTFTSEGIITDATYTTSSFFGIMIKQSTSSFFQKHYVDDIIIKAFSPDIIPPVITSAVATSASTLDVLFDEPLDVTAAETTTNYVAGNGLGSPSNAAVDITNAALVHLTFKNNFINRLVNSLTINGIKDIAGNDITNGISHFSYNIPQQYDVVIDEIFTDPSPQVGLPSSEFVELKNVSPFPVNLSGWRLSDNTSGCVLPAFIIQPDSFIIVCSTSAASSYTSFGNTLGVSNFPSLNNDANIIFLSSAQNKIIHAVSYKSSWYQNELKKDGGWTLEMIDTKNPCGGFNNWKASIDVTGGTPGKKNSVDAINTDETSPKLLRAFAVDSLTISLIFDEALDSFKAATAANYTISDGIGKAASAIVIAPMFDKVNLQLAAPLQKNKVYTITANGISDCSGNIIGSQNSVKTGIAILADSFDIVINEILFNSRPGGVDYVEIYNRSAKIIDLKQLYIANRSATGTASSIKQISQESILLFPGDFIVITEDVSVVQQQYVTTNPAAFIKLIGMPSFSDDKGSVVILNAQGNIIDEVSYSDKWHFALITNTEGVSLERIDYDAPSVQTNFHSAATSVGYGTPGYKNSQFRIDQQAQGEVTVMPKIFSPDNDGNDDFATINYSFPEPGYVANITIFDASGRPVRYLQRNALSGIKGNYRWDGLGEKQQKLSQGIYIIFTEIFNTAGKVKQFKNTIVLAAKR